MAIAGGLFLLSGDAHAQTTTTTPIAPVTPTPLPAVPNPFFVDPASGMTPPTAKQQAQLNQLLQLRMLQGMGHHRVQSGVPQPIINGGFGPPAMNSAPAASPVSVTGKTKKSATEKRAEAAVLKEQRKQQLRDQQEKAAAKKAAANAAKK